MQIAGVMGSCRWSTSKRSRSSAARTRKIERGLRTMFGSEPFAGTITERPTGITSGGGSPWRATRGWRTRVNWPAGSLPISVLFSTPSRRRAAAWSSACSFTAPQKVHENGTTIPTFMARSLMVIDSMSWSCFARSRSRSASGSCGTPEAERPRTRSPTPLPRARARAPLPGVPAARLRGRGAAARGGRRALGGGPVHVRAPRRGARETCERLSDGTGRSARRGGSVRSPFGKRRDPVHGAVRGRPRRRRPPTAFLSRGRRRRLRDGHAARGWSSAAAASRACATET